MDLQTILQFIKDTDVDTYSAIAEEVESSRDRRDKEAVTARYIGEQVSLRHINDGSTMIGHVLKIDRRRSRITFLVENVGVEPFSYSVPASMCRHHQDIPGNEKRS